MAGGVEIPDLTSATTPIDCSEIIVVEQGGVTKKSTISASQQIALDAANAAQTTANSASSAASTAQTTANTAVSDAATAQSTANGKLSTVAVDGTTITGNGTVGNPLVANISVPPKEYRGYLTISGGGVAFTSLQNDVGTIVWSVISNGVLNGVLTGAFLSANFFGLVGNLNGSGVPYINVVRRLNDNTVGIDIFKFDGTQTGTPFGTFAIHLIINN